MKRIAITLLSGVALLSIANAATITLLNGDFQGSGNDTNPANWTTVEFNGGVYIYASGGGIPAGTNVLAFNSRPNSYVEQSFNTAETVAGQFASYEVTFDSGWRNNTVAPNDLSLTFSLWNITSNSEISSQTYTFPADTPSNALDTYRVIATGNTLTIADTSGALEAGNTVGLRITVNSSQDTFNPAGWIDNVSVEATAVPEPSSTALLGLAGLGLILRRRR